MASTKVEAISILIMLLFSIVQSQLSPPPLIAVDPLPQAPPFMYPPVNPILPPAVPVFSPPVTLPPPVLPIFPPPVVLQPPVVPVFPPPVVLPPPVVPFFPPPVNLPPPVVPVFPPPVALPPPSPPLPVSPPPPEVMTPPPPEVVTPPPERPSIKICLIGCGFKCARLRFPILIAGCMITCGLGCRHTSTAASNTCALSCAKSNAADFVPYVNKPDDSEKLEKLEAILDSCSGKCVKYLI